MTPALDAALLCSSRAGSDLGRESGVFLLLVRSTHTEIVESNQEKLEKQAMAAKAT